MPDITSSPRALTIDPSPFFREGAQSCLVKGGCEVLAHARSLAEAEQSLGPFVPDLALIGPDFPEHECLALCRESMRRWPKVKLILYSRHANDPLFLADAARAGANACLPREAGDEASIAAIVAVMAGHQLFPREILSQALQPIGLTTREQEVLKLMAGGKTDREIAAALTLSPATVRNHSQRIVEKLGVHERREAVRCARRLGWLF